MITLYHAPQSRSSRIVWLLEELGAPYAIRPVSIYRPMTGEGEPDAANPHPERRVPAIDHDGVLITESIAVVQYLCEVFPAAGLLPAIGDPRRAACLTWIGWYACEFEPAMMSAMTGEIARSPNRARDHEAVVQRLEGALARGAVRDGRDLQLRRSADRQRPRFRPKGLPGERRHRCLRRTLQGAAGGDPRRRPGRGVGVQNAA